MDYIYSYLNDDVASREMHGSETNTAVVTVNAATNTISVDVKPISPSMLNITKPTESGSYILQETISEIGEVSYSWATLEDYNQEVTQAIANLTQQLEQEKQERIDSVQAEANTRELADTQLRTEFTYEIAQEKQEREQAVSEEAQRTNSMINQLNDNVQFGFNTINNVLTTSINNINNAILNESTIREEQFDDTTFRIRDLNTRLGVEIGNRESWDNIIYANLSAKIENEKRERVEQDQDIRNSIDVESNSRQEAIETLQSNIDAEANERKSVDQHLWNILPDNIIAGTPMQGMENANAINIVFSKYQKHGIGEDPADAELVEVPNQAITLFPATQEVAGVLTAADKTKIDNIANDIKTAVQAETEARQEADTALENKLDSLIVVEGAAIQVGDEEHELNIKTGGRFTVNSNYEVVTSEEYPGEPGRRIIPLENNDQIAGKKTDGNGVPLIFMSKWNKVEVGGKGAPLNLNSDDGTVTVNDTYTLLNNEDKDKLNDAIKAEENRATQAENALDEKINTTKNDILGDAAESYNTLGKLEDAIQDEATARDEADTAIHNEIDAIDTRVENLEGKTTRLFYEGEVNPPSASDINTWVTGLDVEPKYEAPFEGIAVVVLMSDETYHIWHYYSNLSNWRDDGVDTVSTFTNDKKGIIQGSTNDGYVAAENGIGKVSGWNTVKTDITNLQNNLSSNVSNINNSISNINQNVANIANDLAANVVTLGNAYTQANNAYTQANTAYNRANEAYDLAIVADTLATDANTVATTANNAITTHAANTDNPHYVTKEQIGLGNVDNTSDLDKPISTATQTALDAKANINHASLGTDYGVGDSTHYGHVKVDSIPTANSFNAVSSQGVYGELANKVDKVDGKQLSTEDFTTAEKTKLAGIEEGAEKNLVISVAGMTGAVTLGTLTFSGAVTGSYSGTTDVEIDIPSIGGEVGPAAGFGTPTASVTTLNAGENATVSVQASGDNTAKVFEFNFGIPKGADGTPGQSGKDGSDGQDGAPGANGYTWIPSVATNGIISWEKTQEGPGDTPLEVNIMGPTGPAISTNIATITFFDAASNESKTIKFYVVDEAYAGNYEIGINDGTL